MKDDTTPATSPAPSRRLRRLLLTAAALTTGGVLSAGCGPVV